MSSKTMSTNDSPWRDEETLRELYVEKGMSSREVSDELGCGKKAILRWLDRHDIPKETPTHERPPSFQVDSDGRVKVKAQHKYKQYSFLLHRLVAVSKCGFDEVAGSIVHHKNGVPWDNRPENLELVNDQAEHMERHHGDFDTDLSPGDVREIRKKREQGISGYKIAQDYPVTPGMVYDVANKKVYKWVD